MPKREYAFEKGGPKVVQVEWTRGMLGRFASGTVRIHGVVQGTFESAKALREGGRFELAEGGTLRVEANPILAGADLKITVDGISLPLSEEDFRKSVGRAATITYLLAVWKLLQGILDVSSARGALVGENLVLGVLMGIAGFMISKESRGALALVMGFLAIDMLHTIGEGSPGVEMFLRVAMLVVMARAWTSMAKLRT